MDIKAKINELVEKIKADPQMLATFKTEPVKVIETLLGVDLPDELVGTQYYVYGDNKIEQAAKQYWDAIKGEK